MEHLLFISSNYYSHSTEEKIGSEVFSDLKTNECQNQSQVFLFPLHHTLLLSVTATKNINNPTYFSINLFLMQSFMALWRQGLEWTQLWSSRCHFIAVSRLTPHHPHGLCTLWRGILRLLKILGGIRDTACEGWFRTPLGAQIKSLEPVCLTENLSMPTLSRKVASRGT